ncbi:MAG TPA: 2-hydroxyacid dehydrogenase [Marinobacterium sp.]|nr:2-hydroxyacid dehydrogenase [Marinobacterium sp.]
MNIVFHGANAQTFMPQFETLLEQDHQISFVPDQIDSAANIATYQAADIVIGIRYDASLPQLNARLYQLPSAGYDKVDLNALPATCEAANVFGHERAIAEYVMMALLSRHVPLFEADQQLRQRNWHYWAGKPTGLRTELGSETIGIVGHGHIGQEIAKRAQAFGMQVMMANRSPIDVQYNKSFSLENLSQMAAEVDILVNCLPLTPATESMIDAKIFDAMKADAVFVNVGRGAVADEQDLFNALKNGDIGSAIIDTWYQYPSPDNANPTPSVLPFAELNNVLMTPHMSGWTDGTIARRQRQMADNINRLARGEAICNSLK